MSGESQMSIAEAWFEKITQTSERTDKACAKFMAAGSLRKDYRRVRAS